VTGPWTGWPTAPRTTTAVHAAEGHDEPCTLTGLSGSTRLNPHPPPTGSVTALFNESGRCPRERLSGLPKHRHAADHGHPAARPLRPAVRLPDGPGTPHAESLPTLRVPDRFSQVFAAQIPIRGSMVVPWRIGGVLTGPPGKLRDAARLAPPIRPGLSTPLAPKAAFRTEGFRPSRTLSVAETTFHLLIIGPSPLAGGAHLSASDPAPNRWHPRNPRVPTRNPPSSEHADQARVDDQRGGPAGMMPATP
jgi:hypothetical protein